MASRSSLVRRSRSDPKHVTVCVRVCVDISARRSGVDLPRETEFVASPLYPKAMHYKSPTRAYAASTTSSSRHRQIVSSLRSMHRRSVSCLVLSRFTCIFLSRGDEPHQRRLYLLGTLLGATTNNNHAAIILAISCTTTTTTNIRSSFVSIRVTFTELSRT